MGAKINKKSIKIRGQHAKASSHGFFIDFGGFWEPSWKANSSQDRLKMASKNDWAVLRASSRLDRFTYLSLVSLTLQTWSCTGFSLHDYVEIC